MVVHPQSIVHSAVEFADGAVIAQLGNASKPSEPNRARMYLRMAKERGELNAQESFDTMVQSGSWKFIP